jgi:hypothetical protein
VKQVVSQEHVEQGLQECLYIKHYDICWPLVSYAIDFNYEDSEDTEEDPVDPEQVGEGGSQMEYPSE